MYTASLTKHHVIIIITSDYNNVLMRQRDSVKNKGSNYTKVSTNYQIYCNIWSLLYKFCNTIMITQMLIK